MRPPHLREMFERMNGIQASKEPVVVLLPLYNDWESLQLLLVSLDGELACHGVQASSGRG